MINAYISKKEEESKEKITLAYINAMWTVQWLGKKSQQPKPLNEILNSTLKEKTMTDEDMLKRVKSLNAMLGGEVNM